MHNEKVFITKVKNLLSEVVHKLRDVEFKYQKRILKMSQEALWLIMIHNQDVN